MKVALLAAGLLLTAATASAQEPIPLRVGDAAPDFSLPAATASGVLAQPVRLGDFRGQTVILAFFYKARTKG